MQGLKENPQFSAWNTETLVHLYIIAFGAYGQHQVDDAVKLLNDFVAWGKNKIVPLKLVKEMTEEIVAENKRLVDAGWEPAAIRYLVLYPPEDSVLSSIITRLQGPFPAEKWCSIM